MSKSVQARDVHKLAGVAAKLMTALKRPKQLLYGTRLNVLRDAAKKHRSAESDALSSAARAYHAERMVSRAKDRSSYPQAEDLLKHVRRKRVLLDQSALRQGQAASKIERMHANEGSKVLLTQSSAIAAPIAAIKVHNLRQQEKIQKEQRERRKQKKEEKLSKHAVLSGALGTLLAADGMAEKLGFSGSSYGGQPAQNGPGMRGRSQIPAFVAPPLAVKEATQHRPMVLLGSRKKEAGMGVGAGMSASQYSGPLSYGPFKQESATPAFVSPAMTKTDPRLEAPAYATGGDKTAGAATGAMSAVGRLRAGQRSTAPKLTGFAGPSIAEIAKPQGFGKPLSGALKNTI